MAFKKQIEGKIELKDLKLYINDEEYGLIEIQFEEKPMFNNHLWKYNGLNVKATIYNFNDGYSIGVPMIAMIDEIIKL